MTRIAIELREAVVQRALNQCEYCHLPQASQVATFPVDHIRPVVDGGATEFENLALACPSCNSAKWIHTQWRDAETNQTVNLFNPRTDQWSEHFRWSPADQSVIDPLTPIGRATVALLELNSPNRCQIRHWLMVIGQHPR